MLQARPFTTLASETGQATTDTPDGWQQAIDAALRALGVGEGNLVTHELTAATRPVFLAHVRVAALEQIRGDLVAFGVRTTIGAYSLDPTARIAALDRLLAEARAAVIAEGASGTPAHGVLTQTAPILPAVGQADPNARRYRGDALLR